MRHKVQLYDIEKDKSTWREFDTYEAAKSYANELTQLFLNQAHPAPVFIDVMPVE